MVTCLGWASACDTWTLFSRPGIIMVCVCVVRDVCVCVCVCVCGWGASSTTTIPL